MKQALFVFIFLIVLSCGEKGTFINNSDHCDGYKSPIDSKYILPFQVGESYLMYQGNCGQVTHRAQIRFAYDFDMPIGTPLLAIRSGTVHTVVESHSDEGTSSWLQTNHLYIVHNDGSMAAYVHLQENGILVEEGDQVTQGDIVAYSGNSGTQTPHLHFHVYSTKDSFRTIPINFRNQGEDVLSLIEGRTYTAESFTPNDN